MQRNLQDMKLQYFEIENFPVVIIDQYYEDDAVEQIWNELIFLNKRDKLHPPEVTGSATYDYYNEKQEVVYKKKNRGVFLDDVYRERKFSDILYLNRKIFTESLIDNLIESHVYFRHIKKSTADSTLISYYEDNDYYDFHTDNSSVTLCSWFFQEPKKFIGGDLILEKNNAVECKHNRTIIFPSILEHKVEAIQLDDLYKDKNYGRFTITQLIGYKH